MFATSFIIYLLNSRTKAVRIGDQETGDRRHEIRDGTGNRRRENRQPRQRATRRLRVPQARPVDTSWKAVLGTFRACPI